MTSLQHINGIPVSYINGLPTRQINAFGTIFRGKYDPKSGLIFMLDEEGELTETVMQVPHSNEHLKRSGIEVDYTAEPPVTKKRNSKKLSKNAKKAKSRTRFHPIVFLSGAALIVLVTAIYVAIQYAIYEGIL